MTKSIAFVFPGQGSQYQGMGKNLAENFETADNIFDKANQILDIDLKKLLIDGPESKLNNTKNTQPAIFTVSYALNQILRNKGIKPEITAGHSLGEYSALGAVNSFSFEDGLNLVRQRGILMDQAVPEGQGSMAALIGMNKEDVESLCNEIPGIIEIANYNTPNQIVISGDNEAIEEGLKLAEEKGARKAIKLNVSGPFHSSLMKPVQERLKKEIEKTNLNDAELPVIANVTAKSITRAEDIKKELLSQLNHSVLWVDTVNLMLEKGIDTFIEVGPGRILKGLIRRIDRTPEVLNVQDQKSLEKTLKKLN